jgi:hypothetical protein
MRKGKQNSTTQVILILESKIYKRHEILYTLNRLSVYGNKQPSKAQVSVANKYSIDELKNMYRTTTSM